MVAYKAELINTNAEKKGEMTIFVCPCDTNPRFLEEGLAVGSVQSCEVSTWEREHKQHPA